MTTTVAHLLCQGMKDVGIDHLYCLPGVQNDDFFNALVDYPEIKPIATRNEQACSYMAAGAAQASGKPQAYCVVPGQAVLNAGAGHSTAFSTASRVLALLGENKSHFIGRMHGQLHELADQTAIVSQMSKHTETLMDPATPRSQIQTALSALISGHPAPVSVQCPLDRWITPSETLDPVEEARPEVDLDAVNKAADLLADAKNPIIVLGGGAHGAPEAIVEIAEMLKAPVSALRQGKGAYDEARPLAVMGPVAHEIWKTADVALGIGTRFMWHEMVWGVDDALSLIQINADPGEINRRGNVAVPICAMVEDVLPALIEALGTRLGAVEDRTDHVAGLKGAFDQRVRDLQPTYDDLMVIRQVIGEDGIFVDDLTQVAYAARYILQVHRPRGYVCAGYAGTLGWGMPAGLGAALASPGKRVITVQGDGGFLYCAQELATSVKHRIPHVTLVYNDNAYGNVQRIQEDRFGHNRTIATDLHNPDFVKYAESFGAFAIRSKPGSENLRLALEEAFAQDGPAVVEMPTPERYPSPWGHIFLPTVRGPSQAPLLANG
ncbi:MAG: thiamine pyrophosphate-dependent enzyme [Pseudomonadota bacterium]